MLYSGYAEYKQKYKLSRSVHTQRQQQPPTRDLQKTHTDRHYYTLYIQPSIRTQIHSVHLLHKQNVIYINHTTSKTQEWNTICTIARNNGFPLATIYRKNNQDTKDKKYSLTNTKKEMDHIYVS